ncbi:MAG: metallophosphoesterase [Hyphomicrobiaceae bacterium]
MKIALVSDIHADRKALKRVFDDLPSVDRVLCAGDAVSEFRFCPETVDLLREHRVACIQGNHEHVLFNANPGYLAKCRAEYAPELLDMLALAPTSLDLEAAGARLHMIHATPWSPFSGYINPGSPQLARMASLPYDFVVLGHTHVPMVERVGNLTVINPGSCSQPRDQTREGAYAIVDLATREVEIRRLRLD